MKVKDMMSSAIYSILPQASVPEAACQMQISDIGAIPVCNEKNELLGILTDRDIVLRTLARNVESDVTVGDIMSGNVITVSEDTDIHDAALIFSHYKIRRLPVVSGRRLTGMLSISDIAKRTVMADEAGDIMCAISRD